MKKYLFFVAFVAFAAILASCSDDSGWQGPQPPGAVTLSESEVTLPAKGRYYTIAAKAAPGSDIGCVTVAAGAGWISLESDTVYADGTVEFYVADNDSLQSRTATLTLTGADGAAAVCTVTQLGAADGETNAADAYFYVGYGYNIFQDYMNTRSLCAPIVDIDKMAALNGGTQAVQTSLRSRESVDYLTANSFYEMSELMTRQQDKTTSGLKGAAKTVSRFQSDGTLTQSATRYCYMSLKRTVGSSAMDYSVLQQLLDRGADVFTPDFRQAYDKVAANPTAATVDNLLNRFGTHLVTYTEIGGMMDLTVNFSCEAKGELGMRAEDFAGYFFKYEPSDFIVPGTSTIDGVTSTVTVNGTFNIIGGTDAARDKIVSGLGAGGTGRIDQAAMQTWLSDISLSSLDDRQAISDKNIAPVSFRLVPVWSLFPASLRGLFIERATAMSQKAENKNFSDWSAGIDLYAFCLADAKFMNFGTGADQTLVRVVYASNSSNGSQEPVLEVCNEYVPTIRGDRRVTVVYPVKNGRTFHGSGLFPGDGEGNPPAWLTFSDGQVYVKPVSGMGATDVIDSVFFIHGNIYTTNLGISVHEPYFTSVKDQTLTLKEFETLRQETYPIVKIGSGYWTRRNVNVAMGFGEPMEPSDPYSPYYIYESVDDRTDNRLYACVFKGNDPEFVRYNKDVYGSDVDDVYGEYTKWHVPMTDDAYELRDYLGNNLKALFNGQATGFDAQFWGNYSRYDDLNSGKDFGRYGLRYVDEYCFISFKNNDNSATALAVSKDYKLTTMPEITRVQNLYPVRLFRTPYYRYK